MNRFPTFSDDDLQDVLGKSRLRRAANYLTGDHLDAPTVHPNGVLSARWKDRGTLTAVFDDDGILDFDCDCDSYSLPCDHNATLLLAWVRRPEVFNHTNSDFDEGMLGASDDDEAGLLDEQDLLDDLLGEPGPGGFGMPAPRPAPPGAGRSTVTLTTEFPELVDYYRGALQSLSVPQLRALAGRRGVAVSGTRREGLVEALAQALGRPEALAEVWPSLSASARMVLSAAPFCTSEVRLERPFLQPALKSINPQAGKGLDAALSELKEVGLLFAEQYGNLSTPPRLAQLLPPDAGFVPTLAGTRGLHVAEAPGLFDFPQSVTHLLLVLRSEAAQLRLRPASPSPLWSSAGGDWPFVPEELEALQKERNPAQAAYMRHFSVPPAPHLLDDASEARLTKTLGVSPERLDFSLRLLAKIGAVRLEPGQPPQVLEAGFVQYLALNPFQQIVPLFNAWMSMRDWIELDLPGARPPGVALKRQGIYSGEHYANFLSEFSAARTYFVFLLRRAPAGEWVDLEAFRARALALNSLHAMWPMSPGVWMESKGRQLYPQNANDWKTIYSPWLEAVLTGPMHWFGLVDLGRHKDQLAACRLTPPGAFLLFQTPTFNLPPLKVSGGALRFTPGGELVVAPAAAEPQLLNLFSLLCEVRPSARGELTGRVTAEGALRATQAGWDIGDVLALLERSAEAAPPAGLARTLRDWWAHLGDVHLYQPLALLELADDYALNELLASTSLSQHLLYRLGPRLVALRPEAVDAFRDELVDKGYTPKVVRPNPAGA